MLRLWERSAEFYRPRWTAAAAAALLASGCGDPAQPAAAPAAPVFPPLTGFQPAYQAPAGGELLPRYLQHLKGSSRTGLKFAMERIGERGETAAPALVEELRRLLYQDEEFAAVHNLCQALARTGDRASAAVLADVLESSSVTAVRSAALDGIVQLGAQELVPRLLAHLATESEAAPRQRIYWALGALGGAEALDFLEAQTRAWLAGDPSLAALGYEIWSSLLAAEGEGTAARISRVAAGRPPALRVEALARLIALGERQLAAEARAFLDPQFAPGPRVRAQAVQALALAEDWEGVLGAAGDPEVVVLQALIQGLRLPAARAAGAGQDVLEELSRHAEQEVAIAAMQALVERGDRRPLEPWLRLARGYPLAAGSADALHYLSYEGMEDPRTTPILLERWPACGVDERISLLRALARVGDRRALPHFRKVLADPQEDPEVRRMACVQLANFGAAGSELLLERQRQELEDWEVEPLFTSLAGAAAEPPVRELLLQITADRAAPDARRKVVFELLPRALREDAFQPLLAARDAEMRGEVRAFLERLLLEYF